MTVAPITITKVKALVLEFETDHGDIQVHFSAPQDNTDDQATIEMSDENGLHKKVKVEFPFEGVVHFKPIALT